MNESTTGFHYDPFSAEAMHDPLPLYQRLRDGYRAYPLPQYNAWAIPRFEDVWHLAASRDTTIAEGPVFSRERLLTAAPLPTSEMRRPLPSFSTLDPPVHTVIRKAAFAPFRPRAVEAITEPLRNDVRRLVTSAVERGTFDVVADVASPAVAASTCRLLGLPVADHRALNELVNQSVHREPDNAGVSATGVQARAELHQYLVGWTRTQRGSGGVVDALSATVSVDEEPLTDAEIATQIGTILVGGVETVPKIVAGGVLQLWRNPEQRAALTQEPELLESACEEIMRVEAPLQWIGRTLVRDVKVAGSPMRAGQRLFLLLASANRDEREFPEPDRFDIRRRPTRTLVFGHGTHFCIGAAPARIELQVLIEEFVSAVADYDVDLDRVVRPPSEFQLGYTTLPVRVGL